MGKELTPERIERSYKRWLITAWAFRATALLYTALILIGVVFVGVAPWYLIYLVLPPLWWLLSSLWLLSANDIRDSRHRILRYSTRYVR